jgi:hypothetical protein
MATTAVAHDWFSTPEETQARMRSWAAERGLSYEPLGLLPPASDFLRGGLGLGNVMHQSRVQHGRGAVLTFKDSKLRPARFSENLCSGVLPGGAEGTLCHHSYLYRPADEGWRVICDTVVLAHVPEGARVTRWLTGRPQKTRAKTITVTKPVYGADEKEVDLTPALRERIYWEVDADEDTEPLSRVFDPDVMAALEAAPELTRITVREGWLAVELPEAQDDPAALDALCRLAGALAAALRRAAAGERTLEPGGGPLPEPPSTPYRRYLDEGVARVRWEAPPPDVKTAIERYLAVAKDDPQASRRGARALAFVTLLFAALGLVIGAIVGLTSGMGAGLMIFVVLVVLGLILGLLGRRSAKGIEIHGRAEGWGREAFAREYAKAHGLRIENPEQLRRRLQFPLNGRPERSLYGDLGDGVDGRLVWWRDRSDPGSGDKAYMLALVPGRDGELPPASPPFQVMRAGGWLVVVHDLDTATPRGARTAAGADALRAEAVRLARS